MKDSKSVKYFYSRGDTFLIKNLNRIVKITCKYPTTAGTPGYYLKTVDNSKFSSKELDEIENTTFFNSGTAGINKNFNGFYMSQEDLHEISDIMRMSHTKLIGVLYDH